MKKDLSKYSELIEFNIQGIPCLIGLIECTNIKGSYSYDAPSDWDYHGHFDADWEILDRKGYPAAWLENKGYDYDEVEAAIIEHLKKNEYSDF